MLRLIFLLKYICLIEYNEGKNNEYPQKRSDFMHRKFLPQSNG